QKGAEALINVYPDLVKKYGKTFGFYFGSSFDIVTTDPEIIKEVFISKFSNFIDRRNVSIAMVYPTLDSLVQVDHIGTHG
ncbi:hypothetical protein PENTCL1PPCAC_16319, partial [Pristionchus entomophagus]